MITQLTDKAIGVVVPEATINPTISNDGRLRLENKIHKMIRYKPLPEGKWEVLGMADNLTEDQWREVVGIGYEEYRTIKWRHYETNEPVRTALESGQSLLSSKKLSADNTLILIKQ